MHSGPNPSAAFFAESSLERTTWKNIYQKNIRLNAEVKKIVRSKVAELQMEDEDLRICGVHCRGTDYLSLKPTNHPIQPSTEEVIEKTRKVMTEHSCDKVFLATEDALIAKKFASAFGNKLVMAYPPYEEYEDGEFFIRKDMSLYQSGLEYLCTLEILSSCTCIIGTACGGSMMAALMANNPEYEYYFWLGLYE